VILDRLPRQVARYGLTFAAVAVATLVVALLAPVGRSVQPLIYLGAVLFVAVVAGRAPAIAASVLAFGAFDFFFVEPRFTFTVRDPSEWVALVSFLIVAVVTSQLAAAVRDRAGAAERREREARLLHDLADLMAITPLAAALSAACERLRTELRADAVGIVIDRGERVARLTAGDPEAVRALRATPSAVEVLTQGASATAESQGAAGRLIRVSPPHGTRAPLESARLIRVPIRRGSRTLGQLAILPGSSTSLTAAETRLLDTAADQIALAVEREQLRQDALEAEVLRRTDELKSALLDAVSHDLRTPLASIIGSAGSLRQADVSWSAAEREDFARTIEQEAERLNRIVGNLLDLSRIQGGTLRPARAWHDPALVLRDAAERLRDGRQEARITIDVPDTLAPAYIDPVEIDQVVANLVENALKYAIPNGEVRLSARDLDGTLEVTVDDNGPGIASAALPRLFEPFYRAPGADAVRGSGLGLAVARGLVDAHGGRIWAENRPDGGARFAFAIPSPPRPESEEPA
jgi:two-component system sensor histidine kinase KdpD